MHLPQLGAAPQDEPGEQLRRQRLLERLALKAQGFTPRVSLAPPDGLLLEVKGSLKLFDGANNLCRLIEEEHRAAGVESMLAVAPTPLAALACARAHKACVLVDHALLVSSVVSLPLIALRWPEEVIARLAKIGVYTVGQALRLPRAGFARRFGAAQLASLDRLTGRVADPRARFHARERFRRRRELSYEIDDQAAILRALDPLLRELESFLRVRQAGITQLQCRFRHRHAPPTSCVLQLAAPAADASHLAELLGERLNLTNLPEAVRSCELRTDLVVPLAPACVAMWQPGEHGGSAGAGSPQLIEHLRARLDAQAVHGVQLVSDHRPERMSRSVEPDACVDAQARHRSAGSQPLWLLSQPRQLDERAGMPWLRGALHVCGDPQRIETGWWDEGAIARDYYFAIDAHGVRLWVFRERASPHRWFLHGVFG